MKRSNLQLAALTSAVLPNLPVAGVRETAQASATDEAKGIDQAIVQDASGRLYDVFATDCPEGRKRLIRRVKAARTLADARETGSLGFGMDRVIAFVPGDGAIPGAATTTQAMQESASASTDATSGHSPSPTGGTSVLVTEHREGQARSLDLLTIDDCTSMGTALGAIHRLSPGFLTESKYPAFTTGQIRSQLTGWIKRLRSAGHVPTEITNSWARIIETEGLWLFRTCTTHGGFSDGDVLFSGSTIVAVTNWQDMQVNDPARDLAWTFGKLDESHRNAVLSAYGRMMGSRLDDLIMLRANLWLQMEQVGDFIQALNRGDNDRIIQFKAQVERLAHQLGVLDHGTVTGAAQPAGTTGTSEHSPSTITVGTLLQDDQRRREEAKASAQAHVADDLGPENDDTPDPDRTGSAQIVAVGEVDVDDTADRPAVDDTTDERSPISTAADDDTASSPVAATGTNSAASQPTISDAAQTIALQATDQQDDRASAETTVIPLLEREERALRDAQAGIDDDKADNQ